MKKRSFTLTATLLAAALFISACNSSDETDFSQTEYKIEHTEKGNERFSVGNLPIKSKRSWKTPAFDRAPLLQSPLGASPLLPTAKAFN